MKLNILALIAGTLVVLSAVWAAVWYISTHDFKSDLIEAEQYQRFVAGTYATQSERPNVNTVPCDPPADAPAFTKGWQWYCPKAK